MAASIKKGMLRIFPRRYIKTKVIRGVDSAPSVAIQVSIPKLPSPPYPSVDEESPQSKGQKIKLLPEDKVIVEVGQGYDFITTGVIARVVVEKIWQEKDGNTFVIISQISSSGRATHAIHVSEFKQRVLAGGVQKISI